MHPGRLPNIRLLILSLLAIFLLGSCSTTRILSEDQTRLKSNVITVTNRKQYPDYKDSHLDNYIRQKANTYLSRPGGEGGILFCMLPTGPTGRGKAGTSS